MLLCLILGIRHGIQLGMSSHTAFLTLEKEVEMMNGHPKSLRICEILVRSLQKSTCVVANGVAEEGCSKARKGRTKYQSKGCRQHS